MIDRTYIASALAGSRLTLRKISEIVAAQNGDIETRTQELYAAAPPALRGLLKDRMVVHKLLRDGVAECSFRYNESASFPSSLESLTESLCELERAWSKCVICTMTRTTKEHVTFRITGFDPERDAA